MRVALVTGAGRGIGRAIARRLSAEGCRVALVARNREQLDETAAECAGQVHVIPADVTDADAAERVHGEVEQRWGPVEILVANAGAGHSARLERTTDADWQRMLDLNLTAPFRFVRRSVPSMRAAGWGRIVVMASTAARLGEPYIAAYTASKHGVLGLVRAAAAELARTGVTVNAVCPGYVDTPMTEQTIATIVATTGRSAAEARETLARKQPIGRLIQPDEVAEAVWFCVRSGAVTGQAIQVDGGAEQ
ncbi:SDR family NAD(P)-dependent oxidoreductase [Amycolatopsis methanolica]|uniref:Short-chain dehydrogenase/reductase SDR n=1 Tax=Amycolatopsis methanolica 239 TaxID=1068978 RepID=A0A076MSA8_AMYME|nr:SDR family NAD(P)-dependent oxidoreductase [Amycolatopsis methanolica]AIJ23763.1 short-chain dehydrogenase/reductase SDR [Amycolatopsis methanolica 239]